MDRMTSGLTLAVVLLTSGCGPQSGNRASQAAVLEARRTAPVPSPRAELPERVPAQAAVPWAGEQALPVVSDVRPAAGSANGGARVTILGSGLASVDLVEFGLEPATELTVIDDTELTVTSPAGVPGKVDVRVTSAAGTATLVLAYEYLEPGLLTNFAGNPTGIDADDLPALEARLKHVFGSVVDEAGNLFFCDATAGRIRVVCRTAGTYFGQPMTAGHIYTLAGSTRGFGGDGGPATEAQLDLPCFLLFDADGNLLVSDSYNGRIRAICRADGTYYGVSMVANSIYTIVGSSRGYSGDGGPALEAQLQFPTGMAFDAVGNLFFSDAHNSRIRVLCQTPGNYLGAELSTVNSVYHVAGAGRRGFSGDGSPAAEAELFVPQGVSFDPAGNLVVADTNNHRLRVICASAGTHYGQQAVAGAIYTIAGSVRGFSGDGGPAAAAQLFYPFGITHDARGNLVVADLFNCRIRTICAAPGTYYGVGMPQAGAIYTIAGSTPGDSGDGLPATSAQLYNPAAVSLDAAGRLYVSDTINGRVRVVNP